MKAFLMHRGEDLDLERELPVHADAIAQDLELEVLVTAMAQGDRRVADVARHVLLTGLPDPNVIRYRQEILRDSLAHPEVVRHLYGITVDGIDAQRKVSRAFLTPYPRSTLGSSVRVIDLLLPSLRSLREVADRHAASFRSEGFARFFQMLSSELSDEYFDLVERHLSELEFRRGVLMTARPGRGFKGAEYVIRGLPPPTWFERVTRRRRSSLSFRLIERDQSGAQALKELQDKGLNPVANAVAQASDHILDFLRMLQTELAFYLGALNLFDRLAGLGAPICFPDPSEGGASLTAEGLYDPCLALTMSRRVVANDIGADGKRLIVVTGANQGGKSTFLRSLGLAYLMMQSGMFVPAERFRADARDGIFTHFKREEDASMTSGKLDEELSRMRRIIEHIGPRSILLCNESFASTNEREGSAIGGQVVRALTEAGVKVVFVTHLFELARGLAAQGLDSALFLQAERGPGGERSFRVVEGGPLPTSYGEDSFRRIFGADAAPERPGPDHHVSRARIAEGGAIRPAE